MNGISASLVAFATIFGGAFIGAWLRRRLPEHHLGDATKDIVRLGTGLLGTLSALVLGLLIASANSSYDTQSTYVRRLTANLILLDEILAQMDRRRERLAIPFVGASDHWSVGSGTAALKMSPSMDHSARLPWPR